MPGTDPKFERLLQERFEGAESIADLRERLRDVEEELHSVFASELSRFVGPADDNDDKQRAS
ncbi:hypothetical protein [Ferrimonas balearica]|uniref:hypothetical protein n=1 Tax=Ferrimonas balearica TaxID=44012 RepID=UPI001C94FEBC|nr:hypothetical protein [Ferrimonas balearica]MBY5979479.1 hypothetical protein [Ferrimonas balearica]MBY6016264.1 hypothetical protein [Halomonas denitrificans]MBY6095467.1 hypothetical protein [Ferrimonas balearica]